MALLPNPLQLKSCDFQCESNAINQVFFASKIELAGKPADITMMNENMAALENGFERVKTMVKEVI